MKTMIAIPAGGRRIDQGMLFALLACGLEGYHLQVGTGGPLSYNFNNLFCRAVAAGCDRFLMWHQDVVPVEPGWAAKMLAIMEARKLAALSVVMPIKNNDGMTSTAVMQQAADGTQRPTNISRDVEHSFPDTFTLEDARLAYPGATALLVNTGLLLIDLTRAGPAQGFVFTEEHWIKDGKADFMPEDWHYSLQLAKAGLPYAATTAIRCLHFGEKGWEN